MQVLTIMQGVPGSGKSFVAEALSASTGATIRSTDSFFYVDGEYRFDPKKLGEYHKKNLMAVIDDLNKGNSVIVDNTNIEQWAAKPYVEAARKVGAKIQIIRVNGEFDNQHGVPQEKIEQMKNKMEDLSPLLKG